MEDNLYKQALISFNNGDYEGVINIYLDWEANLSEKEKVLLRESRKQVTEQYLFLIKDHIQQKEYHKAKKLQEEYILKYNFDDRIAGIEVVVSTGISNREETVETQKESITGHEGVFIGKNSVKSNKRKLSILGFVALFLLITSVAGVLVYNNIGTNDTVLNNSDINTGVTITQSDSYTERSKEFFDKLANQYGNSVRIIGKYPKFSKYNVAVLEDNESRFLLLHDLDKQTVIRKDLYDLEMKDGSKLAIYGGVSVFENATLDKILMIGDNNGNGMFHLEYLIEIAPENAEMHEVDWGNRVEYENGQIAVFKNILLKEKESVADNEFAVMAYHYDLNGIPKILTSPQMFCKGNMDGYPIEMNIFIDSNNNISGKYENTRYGISFNLAGKQQKDGTLNITATRGDATFYFFLSAFSNLKLTGYGHGINKNNKLDVTLDIISNRAKEQTSKAELTLSGKIDNKYRVVMNLTNNNGEITGSYYYTKSGSNNTLRLEGDLANGKMQLFEYNHKNENTGIFDGILEDYVFHGTFTNYKNVKMPFELRIK